MTTFPIYATINNNDPDGPRVRLEVRRDKRFPEHGKRFTVWSWCDGTAEWQDTEAWGTIGKHDPVATLRQVWAIRVWDLEIEP